MNVKKKIILIGSIPPPFHGSSIYFRNLLNSKISKEFDVTHLDISDHRNLDNLSKLDITNINLALKNIFSLYKLLWKTNPDLIYIPVASNFLPYLRDGLFILISSYFSKAKIVIHLHEGNYFRTAFYKNANPVVKYFIRKSLSKVNTAIVLGEKLKNIFKDLVKNVVVCPNGIENISYNHNLDKENFNKGKIIVSFLGNLFESKGVLDLLNAVPQVLEKYDVEFRFAGAWITNDGNTKEKAGSIIAKNNIRENVKFSGIVTGTVKKDFLNSTDIFVFPTWYQLEGFPLVILEAMSASCPVISTNETGAISDIVADGETGILIDKKRPDLIAGAIIKLIKNPEMRIEMGRRGKERFLEFYTLEINIERMIGIFNQILN